MSSRDHESLDNRLILAHGTRDNVAFRHQLSTAGCTAFNWQSMQAREEDRGKEANGKIAVRARRRLVHRQL